MSRHTRVNVRLGGLSMADRRVRAAVPRSVDRFGLLKILGPAQDYCPIRFGYLKDSAHELPAQLRGNAVEKQQGFTAAYAAAVHENIDAEFNTDANPRAQAKYLERAVREAAKDFAPFLGRDVRATLSGGGGK